MSALLLCALLLSRAVADAVVDVRLGEPLDQELEAKEVKTYCYTDSGSRLTIKWWNQITFSVRAADRGFQVQGAAADDVHGLLDSLVHREVPAPVEVQARERQRKSFLRSVMMDCPAPWAANKTQCHRSFSPFGKSCISVAFNKPRGGAKKLAFQLQVTEVFRRDLLIACVVGAGFLLLAHPLSKSKIFQYSSGMLLAVSAGLLLVVLGLLRRKKLNSPLSNLLMAGATAAGYASAATYLVRQYLLELLTTYWEFVIAYVVLMAVLGLCLTHYWIRGDPDRKHRTRILVKWALRLAGLCFVLGSSYSSFATLLLFLALCVAYVVPRILALCTGRRNTYRATHEEPKKKAAKKD